MNAPTTVPLAHLQDRFSKTRAPLARARHLPGEVYTSPVVAALEKERIFLQTWLCVGRAEEIPHVGDYIACQIANEPFVLSRDKSGEVVAFMNMCLHRGVAVAAGKGNAKQFACPYHAWNYDLGGNLIGAPQMKKAEVDLKSCRLRRLQCQIWRGWIFVSFNPQAVAFEEFIRPYEEELWWFKTDQCRLAEKLVIEIGCNWKLLNENLVDIYHVPVLHRASFGGMVQYKPDEEIRLLPRGGWGYEQSAKPHSSGGEQLFPMLPWLEGMSATTSHRGGLYPNITLSMRSDSLRLWQCWPQTLTTTRLEIYLLFPEVSFGIPKFQENFQQYKTFVHKVVAEDASMVVSLQNAMASPFYEPGPMSHMESAVHHIMNHYLDVINA